MKITSHTDLPNGLGLSIIEVDNPTVVQHFDKRFQIAVVVDNKKILPKLKKKFLKFRSNNYVYSLKSEKTGENVRINEILYHEKQLCDRSWDDCTTELFNYISMYNQGLDVKKELRKTYKF
jgi:hypothetical protein